MSANPDNPSAMEILSDLVSFDTNPQKSNLEMTAYIEALVQRVGARSVRVPSADGMKTGLLVSIGPSDCHGIVLSAHMDVVPVTGQNWSNDPFKMHSRDDRAYGRGTVDMKGFIAVSLVTLLNASKVRMTNPLHLALSYDEEIGCFGAEPLIEYIMANVPKPTAVVVGEPTDLQVVNAHKSAYDFRTVLKGRAAHSSVPAHGSNAIYAAARIITRIEDEAEALKQAPYTTTAYDAPYATLSCGIVQGGTSGNVIPANCEFNWEIRAGYRGEPERIRDEILAFARDNALPRLLLAAEDASIETEQLCAVAALEPETNGFAERMMLSLTGTNQTHSVSFCSEAGMYQAAGLSTVVCGPGSIKQAHQPDEFIAISELERCESILANAVAVYLT
ncbi:acetylornithine deacetylase [Phyllobacterium zundukense]|uniref:Acetylornithine deacetylase n=1 Tax=Phyllobacterium zundukense TaxID=1867719 RepID=A0ACD4CUZ6_9HYPH|nr:acetylornithine deacetylase [Phyllobacterium zundukense]UXN57399.1 acetylornithine deacetylase [Phyllobacterium zundukense]